MDFEEEAQVPFGSGRPAAVEHTQLQRRVLATATLCFRPVLVDTTNTMTVWLTATAG